MSDRGSLGKSRLAKAVRIAVITGRRRRLRGGASVGKTGRIKLGEQPRSFPMVAIGVILLFVAAFAALNRIEFGRFD